MHKLTASKLLDKLQHSPPLPSSKFLDLVTKIGDAHFIAFCEPKLNGQLIDYQTALNLYLNYWAQRRPPTEGSKVPLYEKKSRGLR